MSDVRRYFKACPFAFSFFSNVKRFNCQKCRRNLNYIVPGSKTCRKWTLWKAKAWFSYIVIHWWCPCGLIVSSQRWIKSIVFLKSFSPSVIPDNRSPMNCDIWKPGLSLVHTCRKYRGFSFSGVCEWILNEIKYGTNIRLLLQRYRIHHVYLCFSLCFHKAYTGRNIEFVKNLHACKTLCKSND